MTDLSGKSTGRYHILEQLGQGGMAIVYKAYDTRLERDVAIKVIRTDAFPPAILERVLKRFEREAKALAKLDHPNIVAIYDYGEHEGAPYLVMPYLSGGTLKQHMGKPVSEDEVVRLILPIAQALSYAHEHGILHRDVKPSNILIGSDGVPRLGDFGIGKLLEQEDGHTLTGTGVGVGTPEYMAPEQGLGRDVDARADVYSLGVVLYELVTGHKPYTADTPMAVVVKHLNDPLPRPCSFNTGVSDEMERVLFKALAKKPEDRYDDMHEFGKALKKLNLVQGRQGKKSKREAEPIPNSLFLKKQIVKKEPEIQDAIKHDDLVLSNKNASKPISLTDNQQTRDDMEMDGFLVIPKNIEKTKTKVLSSLTKAAIQLVVFALLSVLIYVVFLPGIMRTGKDYATQSAVTKSVVQMKTTEMQQTNQVLAVINTKIKTVTPASSTLPLQNIQTNSPNTSSNRKNLLTGELLTREKDNTPMVYVKSQGDSGFWFDKNLVTNETFSSFVEETGYKTDAEKIDASFVATIKSGDAYDICMGYCEKSAIKPKSGCEASCSSSLASHTYAFKESNWVLVAGKNWEKSLVDGESELDTPVIHISWNDASEYCSWVGGKLPSKSDIADVNHLFPDNSFFSNVFWEWLLDPDQNRSNMNHIYGKFTNSLFPNPDTTTFFSNRSRNLLGFRCVIR